MARQRDPNRDVAKRMYLEADGKIPLKDIAAMLGKSDSQIRKWKNLDKWDEFLKGNVTNSTKSNVTNKNDIKNTVASKGKRSSRSGNPNPRNQFTERNNPKLSHGLYSRFIPDDMQQLFHELDEGLAMEDMLWDNIKIQYLAIMRAQRIMFVESKEEIVQQLKKVKWDYVSVGEDQVDRMAVEEEYEIQFAWDRQAQFLSAQSRAISELRTSINHFMKLSDETDERRLKLEQMRASLEKTREDTIRLQKINAAGDQENTEQKLEQYFAALREAHTVDGETD